MDSENRFGRVVATEEMTESGIHMWKEKIKLIPDYSEADSVRSDKESFLSGSFESDKWLQSDELARAVIGFSS